MFQIIFNELSAAEISALPKRLQLELLAEFQILPEDLDHLDSERFGVIRARGKKVVSLSGERLPDLFRENGRGRHRPSRFAQEHVSGFSFPQQTTGLGGCPTGRDTRVLEVDRARRTDKKGLIVAAV